MTTEKREDAQSLVAAGVRVEAACKVVGLSRASYYRQPMNWRERDSVVINLIQAMLEKVPQAGFWKIHRRLQRKDHGINHKRLYRVYCRLGLNLPRRIKKQLPARTPRPLSVLPMADHQWALDFMQDTLYCGKRFRTLNILDEGTRECLAIEVDTSLPAGRVVRTLERLKEERGLPNQIRVDNGPELISAEFFDWCDAHDIDVAYIEPGKPQQNGSVERFNGSFRREFLNAYLFETLTQVREMSWLWQLDYNDERPHESLGNLPPSVYRQKLENSSLEMSH